MSNSENNCGDSAARLAALRAEIDAVDEALHDLVMRRAELTEHMGALKAHGGGTGAPEAQNPIRPAREAAILRRLAARHSGPLPLSVAVQIWRELIAANLRRQCAFELAVVETRDNRLWDMARAAFGTLTRATAYFRVEDAVRAAAEAPGTLAILPAPATSVPEAQIWPELLAASGAPHVVCALPALRHGDWPEAFAVGSAPAEPSGEDVSFVLVTGRSPCAPEGDFLAQAGLEGRVLAAWPAMSAPGLYCALAAVQGFIRSRDAALERLQDMRREDGGRAALIGAVPAPIGLPDG
ncbi:MAG: chorismate mutase [Alphaproteobacteria bacterium]